jgi:hypothetical protein
MHTFFSQLCGFPIPRRTAVLLVALAWSSLAFCGEIHDAAKDGDLAKVKALLKDNPDLVFNKDKEGMTPLHDAAASGYKDVAELLLANKADVDAKAGNGLTPLHVAAAIPVTSIATARTWQAFNHLTRSTPKSCGPPPAPLVFRQATDVRFIDFHLIYSRIKLANGKQFCSADAASMASKYVFPSSCAHESPGIASGGHHHARQ